MLVSKDELMIYLNSLLVLAFTFLFNKIYYLTILIMGISEVEDYLGLTQKIVNLSISVLVLVLTVIKIKKSRADRGK